MELFLSLLARVTVCRLCWTRSFLDCGIWTKTLENVSFVFLVRPDQTERLSPPYLCINICTVRNRTNRDSENDNLFLMLSTIFIHLIYVVSSPFLMSMKTPAGRLCDPSHPHPSTGMALTRPLTLATIYPPKAAQKQKFIHSILIIMLTLTFLQPLHISGILILLSASPSGNTCHWVRSDDCTHTIELCSNSSTTEVRYKYFGTSYFL